ncbi:MAG: 23S rRNA (adenine(2503)-C(2))-methyltransferase RlmN [Desulfovibrio sp.]|nr:23S rRNA (adenine(2503)-C(2))-methyltransferase RlmN [Desulfovibrio sp.]
MRNILDFTLDELRTTFVEELSEPRYRADQVWRWLWRSLAHDFACMTNVSVKTRERLAEEFTITWPRVVTIQKAQDSTTKFLLELDDGARVETVLIPSTDHLGKTRWSQCLSTQVGCPMACTFCATGQLGFERNMSMGEMLGQLLVGRDYVQDLAPEHPIIKNVVFMGMGEPLLNCDNLIRALFVLNDPHGLGFSPRRITVSTCGIPAGLTRLGETGLCYLALSLHAPNQSIREQIMPKAAQTSLNTLLAHLRSYPVKPREHITFEYLLLRGVNDELHHARELAKIVNAQNGKLNLIVYNKTSHARYEPPEPERVLAFEQELWKHHVTATLRASKGQDIDAACGQLRARS